MNRINHLFQNKSGRILSVFFTAGYPSCDSTVDIIKALSTAGADMIEIGMPFSDPMADGPVIQKSSDRALRQGMNLKLLFSQLRDIRRVTNIPLLMMGYLNPVMQYGIEKFCRDCAGIGIDGIILPDLPLEVLLADTGSVVGYAGKGSIRDLFSACDLKPVFLISPQTSEARIRQIDSISDGFVYMVSSSSTTGVKEGPDPEQQAYFERIGNMKLKNPRLIGFGISNQESFARACQYAQGAIVGSAFVNMLEKTRDLEGDVHRFVDRILFP
jgi:tryptophan synthase alpha chain